MRALWRFLQETQHPQLRGAEEANFESFEKAREVILTPFSILLSLSPSLFSAPRTSFRALWKRLYSLMKR